MVVDDQERVKNQEKLQLKRESSIPVFLAGSLLAGALMTAAVNLPAYGLQPDELKVDAPEANMQGQEAGAQVQEMQAASPPEGSAQDVSGSGSPSAHALPDAAM